MSFNNKSRLLDELELFRGQDEYLSDGLRHHFLEHFFPENVTELVSGLSNVVSAFYGFLLRDIGNLIGKDKIASFSENLFYALGKFKAEQALETMFDIPRDTRAFVIVGIYAVYTASPEYSFSIEKYTENHTIFRVHGIDRYHKIGLKLGISEDLTWPASLPFMKAVNDVLGLNSEIDIELSPYDADSKCSITYHFLSKDS